MMKKQFIFFIFLTAFLMLIIGVAPSTEITLANTENYSVVSPCLNNYMYMDTPEKVAIYGETVAVYDSGREIIFVSGTTAKQYDVDFLDENENIADIACIGDVYVLTDRTRLYNLTEGQLVDLKGYDVTMMAADEGKLYLYNGLRTVYLFDGNNITPFPDSERLIIGATSFVVVESVAYLYKEGRIYRLPLTAETSATFFAEITAEKILSSNKSVIAVTDIGLTVINIADNEKMHYSFSQAFPDVKDIKSIATDHSNVAVLSSVDKATYRYTDTFTYIGSYGCASNANGWYSNPTKIISLGDGVAVWDKGNSRLDRYSETENSHEYMQYPAMPFTSVAVDEHLTFYSDGTTVYMANTLDDTIIEFQSIQTSFDIGAMCANNGCLYVYDKLTGGVYYNEFYNYQSNSTLLIESFTAENFIFKPLFVSYNRIYDIKVAGNDNPVIYANTGNKIELFSAIGKLNVAIELGTEISCFDVDAVGNVYTVSNLPSGTYITKHSRTASRFTAGTPLLLNGSFPIEGINSLTLSDRIGESAVDSAYAIDTTKNLLLKLDLDYIRSEEYSAPEAIDVTGYNDNISFAKSKGSVLYTYPDSFNAVTSTVAVGEILCVLDSYSTSDMLFAMTADGYFGYISKMDTITANPLLSDGTVVALFDTVNVYKLPSTDSNRTVFENSQVFYLLDDCADFGNGTSWYRVSYTAGGNTFYGYLIKTRVMSHTVIPVVEEPVFAKAKSVRLGAQVNIYAMPDDTSAVITSVTDGTKLQLLNEYDENEAFTFVKYNDKIGYVITAELQLDKGLTGGQIAAIVLASATLIITAVYLILSKKNKKLNAK